MLTFSGCQLSPRAVLAPEVRVLRGAVMELRLRSPQRNASDEAFEVAGVEKSGASRILLVFLEYGFQHRLVTILQRR